MFQGIERIIKRIVGFEICHELISWIEIFTKNDIQSLILGMFLGLGFPSFRIFLKIHISDMSFKKPGLFILRI
jgi:hypothetical protein